MTSGLSFAMKSAPMARANKRMTMISPTTATLFLRNCRPTTSQKLSEDAPGEAARIGANAGASNVPTSTSCDSRPSSFFIRNPWIDHRVQEIREQYPDKRQQRAECEYRHDERIIPI